MAPNNCLCFSLQDVESWGQITSKGWFGFGGKSAAGGNQRRDEVEVLLQ